MVTLVFYISLAFLFLLLTTTYFGLHLFRYAVIERFAEKYKQHVVHGSEQAQQYLSHIRFENIHRLIVSTVSTLKNWTIYVKRKFDSKQPQFFLKPPKLEQHNKGSVSFFLRHVSEHKESMKKKDL